jgi:sugar phosphate isomerase/epimerase
MQRLLSTYLFIARKLTPVVLGQIADAGFQGVEIFCARRHFDYTVKSEVREMAQALADKGLVLTSLHAPTTIDLGPNREGGTPLSVCEVDRSRRVEAMDELRRVIDVSDDLPFPRMVLHMGGSRETEDPRKRDAAFSSLENLILHAKPAGVTICIENTLSEMGAPDYLRAFVNETRLTGLRFNFDIGHAHLAEGLEDARIAKSFEPLRELIAGAHIHDNHGEKDEHLPPFDGSIDWPAAVTLLQTVPLPNLPLLLELKEKTGPDAPTLAQQLAAARKSMDRLEKEW